MALQLGASFPCPDRWCFRDTQGLAHTAPKLTDAIVDMKSQVERSTQEVLADLVERVTYHNAENGFCVLRAKARGHRDVVTRDRPRSNHCRR
jgi:hypothetical protein